MERTPRFMVWTPLLAKELIVPNTSKLGISAVGRIALVTGIACVACCAVPMLGVVIGSAAIAGLALYSEKAAIAVAAIGVCALVFNRLTRKASPACNIDGSCGCKPDKGGVSNRDKN